MKYPCSIVDGICRKARIATMGSLVVLGTLSPFALSNWLGEDDPQLQARSRQQDADADGAWKVTEQTLRWAPSQTAIIVCDMWNRHWCQGATARVAEIAPRMNAVLRAARQHGALIVHAPSSTMEFYADWPQRKRAQQTPRADAPQDINRWRSLDPEKEGSLPIDDSDGGCDCRPQCSRGNPWTRQIQTLEIHANDVISDQGEEIYNVLKQRGILNVIVLGVHTNMCVLGRPFSIRSMVHLGMNVVLMRDMTDTMYNSRQWPYVSHFAGTDLVVAHIEKYWCPTIQSVDFIGGQPFRFAADHRKAIALIVGENEYRTWESLPTFAEQELSWRGYDLKWVASSPSIEDWSFPDYESIEQADLLLVSVRRRGCERKMMDLIHRHLDCGKPLIGIRTSSHAFAPRGELRERLRDGSHYAEWADFDAVVLGGNYQGHFGAGPKTEVSTAPGAAGHPILTAIDPAKLGGNASLYRNEPLQPSARLLLWGEVPDHPRQPLAWTHRYGPNSAKVFYTSLGHVDDFANPEFRRLLANAVLWALGDRIPPEDR